MLELFSFQLFFLVFRFAVACHRKVLNSVRWCRESEQERNTRAWRTWQRLHVFSISHRCATEERTKNPAKESSSHVQHITSFFFCSMMVHVLFIFFPSRRAIYPKLNKERSGVAHKYRWSGTLSSALHMYIKSQWMGRMERKIFECEQREKFKEEV